MTSIMPGNSWFQGAHEFTINDPIMVSNDVGSETERKSKYYLLNIITQRRAN